MNRIDWRRAIFEVAIVVVGILIAFRVDEWKDHRAEQREVRESLARLADEFVANRQMCEQLEEATTTALDAVWHVYSSLDAGRILDDNTELFETGMLAADFVPQILISTLAYDEMVASGLLRSLDDVGLAYDLSVLAAEIEYSRLQIPYYRLGPAELASRLRGLADFRFAASPDDSKASVSFDFETLAASRELRNLYFEAVDSHADVAYHLGRICDRVRRVDERLGVYFPDRVPTEWSHDALDRIVGEPESAGHTD